MFSKPNNQTPPMPQAPPAPPNPPMFGAEQTKGPKKANPTQGFGGTILGGTSAPATTSNKTLLGA